MSKIVLQKVLHRLIPDFLGLYLYQIIFFIVRFFLKAPGIEIWCRNSLREKNIEFAFSDIDLTIFVDAGQRSEKVLREFEFLKKIFPILGECNLYRKDELRLFLYCVNRYEISRDPELASQLNLKSHSFNIVELYIYLSYMLYFDRKNLKHHFSRRIKKWNRHISLMKEDVKVKTLLGLQEELNHFFSQHDLAFDWKELLEDGHGFPPPPLCSVFQSILDDRLCIDGPRLQLLDPLARKLLIAQLKWEIWGYWSRPMENLNKEKHLDYLKKITCLLGERQLLKRILFLSLRKSH